MTEVDWKAVAETIRNLYRCTDALEEVFPGRKFTLDGHLVGSIGEVTAAYMFDLTLNPASTTGHDAFASDGRQVEIKYTHGSSVAFRHESQHALVLARQDRGHLEVVYNGPGGLVWSACGKMQKNGQRPISLSKLRILAQKVEVREQLEQVNEAPL